MRKSWVTNLGRFQNTENGMTAEAGNRRYAAVLLSTERLKEILGMHRCLLEEILVSDSQKGDRNSAWHARAISYRIQQEPLIPQSCCSGDRSQSAEMAVLKLLSLLCKPRNWYEGETSNQVGKACLELLFGQNRLTVNPRIVAAALSSGNSVPLKYLDGK